MTRRELFKTLLGGVVAAKAAPALPVDDGLRAAMFEMYERCSNPPVLTPVWVYNEWCPKDSIYFMAAQGPYILGDNPRRLGVITGIE